MILEKDVEDRDKYNRLLRYIYVNGTFINLVMVEEGYAKAYPYEPSTTFKDDFAEAEQYAKDMKWGIWKLSENYDLIKINEFLPNPEGDDDAPMPGGEWVELYNPGNYSIDVAGLMLNDDYGNGIEISEVYVTNSTVIDAGGYLVVFRNGNGKLELNNDGGDEVILSYDDIVIDSISYSDSVEGNSYAYVEGIGWQNTKPTAGGKMWIILLLLILL